MNIKSLAKILCGTTVLCGAGLANVSYTSADGQHYGMQNVSVGVASSCMMSSKVTEAHDATITGGTLREGIGSTLIKVICNDPHGFAIYAVGYNETGGIGDTDLHGAATGLTIPTGLATSGAGSNWAMKLVAGGGTYPLELDYAGSYAAVPNKLTKVAHRSTGTDVAEDIDDAEGATLTTTYRAYISPTQAADTYTNKVLYLMAHPDSDTGGMSALLYMQDMTPQVCEDTYPGTVTTLLDTRDNKEYQVAKLADGNCWMTENLRFGGVNASGAPITINSNNSNLSGGQTFSLTTSTPTGSAYTTDTSWTIGTQEGAPASFFNKSEYYPDDGKVSGSDQHYGYYYNWYAATAGTAPATEGAGMATGSICPKGWKLPENSTSLTSKSYANLLYRYGIITNITDNSDYAPGKGPADLAAAPLQLLSAGYHNASGTSVYGRGSYGEYWASSAGSATRAYGLYSHSSDVGPRGLSWRSDGFSVRCVAQ